MSAEFIEHAARRTKGASVAASRLRLALRLLTGAGEADPKLFEMDAFLQAQVCIGACLGQKAEIPHQRQ